MREKEIDGKGKTQEMKRENIRAMIMNKLKTMVCGWLFYSPVKEGLKHNSSTRGGGYDSKTQFLNLKEMLHLLGANQPGT